MAAVCKEIFHFFSKGMCEMTATPPVTAFGGDSPLINAGAKLGAAKIGKDLKIPIYRAVYYCNTYVGELY